MTTAQPASRGKHGKPLFRNGAIRFQLHIYGGRLVYVPAASGFSWHGEPVRSNEVEGALLGWHQSWLLPNRHGILACTLLTLNQQCSFSSTTGPFAILPSNREANWSLRKPQYPEEIPQGLTQCRILSIQGILPTPYAAVGSVFRDMLHDDLLWNVCCWRSASLCWGSNLVCADLWVCR